MTAHADARRVPPVASRILTAGCVAVSLFEIAAVAIWWANAARVETLVSIAAATPAVFSAAVGIRAVREAATSLVRARPIAPAGVLADAGVILVVLAMVCLAASFLDQDGYVMYASLIAGSFLLPAVVVSSAASELVLSSRTLVLVSAMLAVTTGLFSLFVYVFGLYGA